jgi:hypothetical protein
MLLPFLQIETSASAVTSRKRNIDILFALDFSKLPNNIGGAENL